MDIGKYSVFFFLSMIKFLFAPFGGPAANLSFLETYLVCVSGGIFSAAIFYFLSEYFMAKAHEKRVRKYKYALEKGLNLPHKKKFTYFNKLVVKMKMKLGVYGVAMYAPLFLSVPIGSIVTAKFYGKEKKTFPIIVFGMIINGLITSSIAYFVLGLF
jgi:hypothetical protein